VAWGLFSKHTQDEFAKWALDDLYRRTPEAAKAAGIAVPEIKLLLENNDPGMMKNFWKRFFFASHANEFFRFGYYSLLGNNGSVANVQVLFKYPDGRQASQELKIMKERNGWKFGYLESGLPF
jgi:hypothetical protein